MKDCRLDARQEITSIVADINYTDQWSEGGNYFGTVLGPGESIVRTRHATTSFTRLFISDFFGKPYLQTPPSGWVENSKLAKCGPASFFDFYESKTDLFSQLLSAGKFVMWHQSCCPCNVQLDNVGVVVSGGEEVTLDGFPSGNGTTTTGLFVQLPRYVPRRCKKDVPLPWTDDARTVTPSFTITHAVTGSADVNAEQLVALDYAGRLDGALAFHWVSPDGVTYKFSHSAEDGEAETNTHRAAVPVLQFVGTAAATAEDAENFQITLESGPSNSYGSFRIAFVGKFARRAVNLIAAQAPAPLDGFPGFTILDYDSTESDQIGITFDGAETLLDVAPCASGDEWTLNMALSETGHVRTGSITFTFVT